MREMTVRKMAIEAATLMAVVVVLVMTGPFGTFLQLGLADRALYWTLAILGGTAIWHAVWLSISLVPAVRRWTLWRQIVASSVASSALLTFGIIALEATFRPGLYGRLPDYPELYAYVVAVTLVISAVVSRVVAGPGPQQAPKPPVAPAPARRPVFHRRIPSRLGGELLALQTEDHYLRIHTRLGSDLVLCRLTDAIVELDGVDGLQVHRSWWVAREAIDAVQRDGPKTRLRLVNGVTVSVSRTYLPAVRAAGWID
jgi:hypothetical protein